MSRPCRTCRLRKKACDKTRPGCKACLNAGRRCEGYDPSVNGVFVNLDKNTIRNAKKPLISEATRSAKRRDVHALNDSQDYFSAMSIHTLDISHGEFRDHFVTLWSRFQMLYARTPDSWSIQISSLGLHSKALDLALISLAAMRLSLSGEKERYEVLSLSAYNESLQLFRRLLQNDSQKALLVVISLIFSLFEATQLCPALIYQSGWSSHLEGAISLLKRQGPQAFQAGGFHVAFKKLREMAILLAFCSQDRSFLAQPEWMKVPWAIARKSSRDQLYDIAAEMTTLPATSKPSSGNCSQTSCKHRHLYNELVAWRRKWLLAHYPDLLLPCLGCYDQTCLCLPEPRLSPSNEFSYTGAEFLALLLVLKVRMKDGCQLASACSETERILTRGITCLRAELEQYLSLPCFHHAMSDALGITEGRCRSLLPIWALSQTADVNIGSQLKQWSQLNPYLNPGVS